MYKLRLNFYLKVIFLISLIAIISAYFIEHVLGHQPCNLCIIERIPYGLSIIFIVLAYIFKKSEKLIIFLLILTFSFSLLISFYHFGIEQGFFKESGVCVTQNSSDIISKDELLKQLQFKTVNCKDVTFRIFGLSLTTFNMLISLIITIILTKIIKNYEKFKS